jgi:hypothetical protein
MPLTPLSQLKVLLITIACCVAGYLTFVFYGGYLVFGFRTFAEFCLIAVPMFILPIALLGYRYPATSAGFSLLVMLLFFGIQLHHFGPPFTRILHNGMQFFKFLSVTVLLAAAAALNRVPVRHVNGGGSSARP